MILTWLTSKQCIFLLIFFICLLPSLGIPLWACSTFPPSNGNSMKFLRSSQLRPVARWQNYECGVWQPPGYASAKVQPSLDSYPRLHLRLFTYKTINAPACKRTGALALYLPLFFNSPCSQLWTHKRGKRRFPPWSHAARRSTARLKGSVSEALPPPLPLVVPNCVLQHLFIIDGQHDGYGHNINVRLTQQRHESWLTLFQSRHFIGPPLKSDI